MRLIAGIIGIAIGGAALAQSYPVKPIRWIVPAGPGAAHDVVARALLPGLSSSLGQVLVIENQPGGTGTIAHTMVARATPDGYTVATSSSTQLVLNPFVLAKVPYDTLKDFAPAGLIGELTPVMFVHSSVPAGTVQALVDYSRANPGKLFYGSGGIGHSFHLTGETLKSRTGADLSHVPYKSGGPDMLKDLFAGRIQVAFYPPSGNVLSQVKAGTIRALATGTERRIPALPDVPTFDETGIANPVVRGWSGLVAPAGTPRPIIERLNHALNQASATPEAGRGYEAMAMLRMSSTPAEMNDLMARDFRAWGDAIRKLGIKPE